MTKVNKPDFEKISFFACRTITLPANFVRILHEHLG